ncbi:DUF6197 family protein [Streptomyces scopuliridis]|uniref:DUF6197 family protein n=1 Tax=Streptomyces scopuliridis TaxID=452529 RepID=UPI00341534E4
MSYTTPTILRRAAHIVTNRGLHTGDQFAASRHGALDACAAIYVAAHGFPVPPEFYTDEIASIRLIECSATAMQAISAISQSLDTEPCFIEIAPGHTVPEHIEHVSNWAATAPIGSKVPPTTSEVIGRLLRTADHLYRSASAEAPFVSHAAA